MGARLCRGAAPSARGATRILADIPRKKACRGAKLSEESAALLRGGLDFQLLQNLRRPFQQIRDGKALRGGQRDAQPAAMEEEALDSRSNALRLVALPQRARNRPAHVARVIRAQPRRIAAALSRRLLDQPVEKLRIGKRRLHPVDARGQEQRSGDERAGGEDRAVDMRELQPQPLIISAAYQAW